MKERRIRARSAFPFKIFIPELKEVTRRGGTTANSDGNLAVTKANIGAEEQSGASRRGHAVEGGEPVEGGIERSQKEGRKEGRKGNQCHSILIRWFCFAALHNKKTSDE